MPEYGHRDTGPESVKANVAIFDRDAGERAGYQYTTSQRLSTRLSNARMSLGIAEACDFKGKRVLDVGCGDGTFTLELARLGASSVLGIDPAAQAIAAAKERVGHPADAAKVSFAVGNVYELDDQDDFDVVVLRGVLHHLPDASRAVASAVGAGREVVVLEPNGANPVLKLIERFSAYHVEHEEQSFLPSTIDAWFEDAGATVRYRRFINLVPIFSPAAIARPLKMIESMIEVLPLVRRFACGQYVMRAVSD